MKKKLETKRRYDLDFLRVLTVFSVFLFHVGMVFHPEGFHISNNEKSDIIGDLFTYLHIWRLPLLFLISGIGTVLAFSKRNSWQFFKERNKRLMIPLILGIYFIVPPQIYLERISEYTTFTEFYITIFEFIPYPEGSFSWHHLWFIAYLLVFSIISIPFINYLKSEKSTKLKTSLEKKLSDKSGFIYLSFPMIIIYLLLKPYFPDQSHDFTDLAYIMFYFFFYLIGILMGSLTDVWFLLKKYRRFYLIKTVLLLLIFYSLYFLSWKSVSHIISIPTLKVIWNIVTPLLAWLTVLSIVAYSYQYLNKPRKHLKKLNEGIYPFYILHQTVIIIVAFIVISLNLNLYLKFFLISLVSFFTIVIVYKYLVYPFNIMRYLFGMKKHN